MFRTEGPNIQVVAKTADPPSPEDLPRFIPAEKPAPSLGSENFQPIACFHWDLQPEIQIVGGFLYILNGWSLVYLSLKRQKRPLSIDPTSC